MSTAAIFSPALFEQGVKGALIGAAAGDAAKGAAVGAGVALLAGGKHIQIPAGAIVEVALKQEIAVP